MSERGARKHYERGGDLSLLIGNHEVVEAIGVLSPAVRPMEKLYIYKVWDGLGQEPQWELQVSHRCQYSS